MDSNRYSVRPATEEDFPFCWDLVEATMRGHIEVSSKWNHGEQYTRFQSRFAVNEWRVVIVGEGPAVGAYAVKDSREMRILTDIYLMPVYQRKGIGRTIVANLMKQASEAYRPLGLLVLKDNNDARRLYESLGMKVVGEMGDQFVMRG